MIVSDSGGARAGVLVTGVGGRSVGLQILLSLEMATTPYHVVATDADAFSFGLYRVPSAYMVPMADNPRYLDRIREILAREPVSVILPGTEAEVSALAPHAGLFKSMGVCLVAAPADRIDLCQDKSRLTEWLERAGLEPPRSRSGESWRELVREVGYPVVAKPRTGSSGSRGVAILASEAEVEDHLSGRDPATTLFQEYVGDAEHEYTVGVLADTAGGIIDSIVLRRKLAGLSLFESRTIEGQVYALSTGYTQGFIVDEPVVASFCEDLVRRLELTGPVNIQCRTDRNGSRVRVFEVHPRFSGSSAIRAEAGFNEPDAIIRSWVFGEPVGRLAYRRNVAAIRAFQTMLVPIEAYERKAREARDEGGA